MRGIPDEFTVNGRRYVYDGKVGHVEVPTPPVILNVVDVAAGRARSGKLDPVALQAQRHAAEDRLKAMNARNRQLWAPSAA